MIKKYFSLIKENKKYLYLFCIGLIFLSLISLIIPYLISKIIDSLTLKSINQIIFYIILLFIFYIINNILSYITSISYTNFFKNNFVEIHKKIMKKIYSLDELSLSNLSKGRIINTVNIDIINISEIPDYFLSILQNLVLIISIIIIFIKTKLTIGIFVLLIDILYIYIANKLTKKSNYYYKGQRRYLDKLINMLGQTLNGLKEIKTSNIENSLNKKFDYIRYSWQNKYVLKRKYFIDYKINLRYLTYISKIILFILLAILLFENNITIGVIVLLISYFDNIFDYSVSLITNIDTIRNYNISFDRILNLLEAKPFCEIAYGKNKKDYIEGVVEFKNVSFSYKDVPNLKNISFKAMPNEMTVIAGKTGSGKTTIFNLLLKLYNLDHGEILIDEDSIENYTKEVYRSNVSVVNQESFMFNMSIKDNLSLVEPNVDRQIKACKRVGIHEFIMSLPKGYNTILRENATNISGGQKRLISLAKTILTSSEILLFDEVTSSLDPKTTNQIINVLKDLKNDHTVIVITHKKELMKAADNLIILSKGKIVANGKFDKLKDNKYFNDLIR